LAAGGFPGADELAGGLAGAFDAAAGEGIDLDPGKEDVHAGGRCLAGPLATRRCWRSRSSL
jgi:hypothetical protein